MSDLREVPGPSSIAMIEALLGNSQSLFRPIPVKEVRRARTDQDVACYFSGWVST